MARQILTDQPLPTALSIGHVEVRRITMAPGVAPGAHTHNGPVFGSIESGSIIYQVEGGIERMLASGDVFYEPAGTAIARFDSGDRGAVFLAYFLLETGQAPEVTFA